MANFPYSGLKNHFAELYNLQTDCEVGKKHVSMDEIELAPNPHEPYTGASASALRAGLCIYKIKIIIKPIKRLNEMIDL